MLIVWLFLNMNNMVNILNEVYVSEETLKLLKEAGFDWDCRKIQVRLGVFDSRPTLAVAQKWIRDNFTSLLKEGQDLFFVINIDESGWASLNLPTDVVKWLKNAL